MCFAGVEQNVSSIFYGTETWDLCFEGVRQVVVCWDYKSAQFATFSSSKASFEFLFWWITFSLLKLLKYCSFPSTWELKEVTKLGGESISSQSFIPSFWPSFMFLWSWNNHVLKDCIWSTFSSLDFNIQFNFYIKYVFLLASFGMFVGWCWEGGWSWSWLFFLRGGCYAKAFLIRWLFTLLVKNSALLSFLELLFVNSWDEWVGTDRLLKHTEENVQKQKALKERLEMEMKTKAVQAPQMKLKNSGG